MNDSLCLNKCRNDSLAPRSSFRLFFFLMNLSFFLQLLGSFQITQRQILRLLLLVGQNRAKVNLNVRQALNPARKGGHVRL